MTEGSLLNLSPSTSKPPQQKITRGHRVAYVPGKSAPAPAKHFLSGMEEDEGKASSTCMLSASMLLASPTRQFQWKGYH